MLEAFKDLPIAAVSFLVASFLPRLGYRRAMALGCVVVGLACAAMPVFPSFDTAKLLFAAIGVSFALVKVSVYSTIGLVASDRKAHASLTNTVEGLFMVGVLGGYWLFASFIDPADPGGPAWLRVYWLLAGLSALTAAVVLFTPLDETGARAEAPVGALKDFAAMVGLLARPLVLVFVISAFLYVLIEQAVGTWLPTFNREVLGLPSAMSVQAASIFAAALAVGRLLGGAVLSRVDWFPVLAGCVIAMGALVLLTLPLARDVVVHADAGWLQAPAAAWLLPLVGLFLAPIYPALNSAMLSALPRHRHAAMTGLLVVFSALGGSTGSLVTGAVFAAYGGERAFTLSVAPMAALLVALWMFRRLTAGAAPDADKPKTAALA